MRCCATFKSGARSLASNIGCVARRTATLSTDRHMYFSMAPQAAAWPLATGQLHAWSKITRRALWVDGVRFPEGSYFEDMATMPWP